LTPLSELCFVKHFQFRNHGTLIDAWICIHCSWSEGKTKGSSTEKDCIVRMDWGIFRSRSRSPSLQHLHEPPVSRYFSSVFWDGTPFDLWRFCLAYCHLVKWASSDRDCYFGPGIVRSEALSSIKRSKYITRKHSTANHKSSTRKFLRSHPVARITKWELYTLRDEPVLFVEALWNVVRFPVHQNFGFISDEDPWPNIGCCEAVHQEEVLPISASPMSRSLTFTGSPVLELESEDDDEGKICRSVREAIRRHVRGKLITCPSVLREEMGISQHVRQPWYKLFDALRVIAANQFQQSAQEWSNH
jgi:hypothetical protein